MIYLRPGLRSGQYSGSLSVWAPFVTPIITYMKHAILQNIVVRDLSAGTKHRYRMLFHWSLF